MLFGCRIARRRPRWLVDHRLRRRPDPTHPETAERGREAAHSGPGVPREPLPVHGDATLLRAPGGVGGTTTAESFRTQPDSHSGRTLGATHSRETGLRTAFPGYSSGNTAYALFSAICGVLRRPRQESNLRPRD